MRLAFLPLLCVVGLALAVPARAAPPQAAPTSIYLEELTWTEVRDAVKGGATTIILPVGGTEQNGPQMALGKHNARARVLAGRIAAALGDTLVAPVVAYVPEGSISPPSGHMRYPGTISISDAAFKGLLEGAARSFRHAGFLHVVLIGDHGGYQNDLKEVAAALNREWAGSPARAHFIDAYYKVTQTTYVQALRARGLSDAAIGSHAGLADTSLTMAIDPSMVRIDKLDSAGGNATGISGDPRGSSAALGQLGVDQIVTGTVAAIRKARQERP
jgi:creatinine amidohydrolase/Fe(II)-dependent formamide hydrolase-like protein